MRLLSPPDAHSHTETTAIRACACIHTQKPTQLYHIRRGQTKLSSISSGNVYIYSVYNRFISWEKEKQARFPVKIDNQKLSEITWMLEREKMSLKKENLCKLCPPTALNSWTSSCTLELSQGHHVACKFALRPGKHPVQLCFFRPGLRVGGYTEVPANTLLGLFQLLGLSEVSVSTALVRGPWSAQCWMKPRTHVLAACDLL